MKEIVEIPNTTQNNLFYPFTFIKLHQLNSRWHTSLSPINPPQKAHLVEEDILSRATGFGGDGILHLPPRLPGQGLHQSLIDTARAQDEAARLIERREAKARAREERAAAAEASAAEASVAVADDANGKEHKSNRPRASTAAAASGNRQNTADRDGKGAGDDGELSDEEEDQDAHEDEDNQGSLAEIAAAYGDEPWLEPLARTGIEGGKGNAEVEAAKRTPMVIPDWDRVPTIREEGMAHDIIVTGPPLSGKSTISRALATNYRIPALTIDNIITEAMRLRSKLGARVRAAIHWFTAREEVYQRVWGRSLTAVKTYVYSGSS